MYTLAWRHIDTYPLPPSCHKIANPLPPRSVTSFMNAPKVKANTSSADPNWKKFGIRLLFEIAYALQKDYSGAVPTISFSIMFKLFFNKFLHEASPQTLYHTKWIHK